MLVHPRVTLTIVNRGDWLGSPANIKGANKDAKIDVGRSTTGHNLSFCAHTPCMNYVQKCFYWLVPHAVGNNNCVCVFLVLFCFCFVFFAPSWPKMRTETRQRTFNSHNNIFIFLNTNININICSMFQRR